MTDRPFLRWQARTIDQLGYANNLLLALGGGGLAFSANLLLEVRFVPNTLAFDILLLSALAHLFSVVAGLFCVFSRLMDFRTTAKITRGEEQGEDKEVLEKLRTRTHRLGKRSWGWFWGEGILFGVGATLLVLAISVHVLTR